MKRLAFFLSLISFAYATQAQTAPADTTIKVVKVPPGFTSQLNVVYTQAAGWDGRLDLYLYLPPAN